MAEPLLRGTDRSKAEYTVYISHAPPERQNVAAPLKQNLEQLSVKPCFLGADPTPSSSPEDPRSRRKKQRAMQSSKWGVAVLTREYLCRRECMEELAFFKEEGFLVPVFWDVEMEMFHNVDALTALLSNARSDRKELGTPPWFACDMSEREWKGLVLHLPSDFEGVAASKHHYRLDSVAGKVKELIQERKSSRFCNCFGC